MNKTGIKIIAALMTLVFLLTGCSSADGNLFVNDYLNNNGGVTPSDDHVSQPTGYSFGTRGTSLSLTADKELNISRVSTGSSPAPNDGIWTVFVYLCGADLESKWESASADLQEMVEATSFCSKLRFVVEAGGSNTWHNANCADGENIRLVISGGDIQTYETQKANMGDPQTLADFLDWGLENYRSQYIMLDMWDHGGGSLLGLCRDERYNDIISLKELDEALMYVLGNRGVKLDMIGCDACLMATVEFANICVPYADYLLASEEVEWNGGWDYIGFANGVNAGAGNGAALGKYVCDAFYSSMNGDQSQYESTLSVTDLSKLDSFLLAFNSYCSDIYQYMLSSYDSVLQNISENMIRFSKGAYWTGDMYSFIRHTSAYSQKAERTLSLLNECVTYKVSGSCYSDAGGIAIFYPFFELYGSYLNIAKNVCVTPYYLGIVDAVIYGKGSMGNITGYDAGQWIDDDSAYWSDNDVNESEYSYWEGEQGDNLNSNADQASILFSAAPHVETRKRESSGGMVSGNGLGSWIFNGIMGFVGSLMSDEYNVYTFTFSNDGLQKVDSVCTSLYMVINNSAGKTVLADLGGMYLGSGNYFRNGNPIVEGEFYGMTVGLPNGSALSVHPVLQRYIDGYGWVTEYYAPVSVNNGELKNLIFFEDYSGGTNVPPKYIAVGMVDFDSDVAASRIQPLNPGDTITPAFPGYYADTLEFAGYYSLNMGSNYVLGTDGAFGLIWNASLPNGNYMLQYRVNLIYGNHYCSPLVQCVVDHSKTYPFYMVG